MINLYTYLKTRFDDVDNVLKVSTDKVWNALNPKNKNNEYSSHSIIERANKFRIEVHSIEHQSKYKLSYMRHRNLLNYLCKEGVLKRIITCKPEDFESISSSIYKYLIKSDLYVEIGTSYSKTSFGELLYKKVFNYDNYRKKSIVGEIYKELGFDKATCPYCNSEPVTIIDLAKASSKKSAKLTLFELDHFYPKSKYPYLALSFYNHIPSCSNCNGKLKRSRDFTISTHIHPYNRCFNDIYTFYPNADISNGNQLKTISLRNSSDQMDNLAKDLSLDKRYVKLLHLCNANELIKLMQDNYDLFESEEDDRYRALFIQSIKSHIKVDKGEILTSNFCKLKRDLVKFFDQQKTIIKD
ncbi:hypothetical protein KW513_15065 [Vibrio fluvialis]|nr:hypothetical protein [Vibrio fluvialis]MBY8189606.1 hypothetical protein [Vibrio fluvialis]